MAKADRDAVLWTRKRVPPPGGALLEDTEKMKQKHHRMLCAFCALVILVSTVFPTAAFAEQPVDAAAAEQTLTRADAAEMQQADAAVMALTENEQYQEMDTDARKDAALAQLDTLAAKAVSCSRNPRMRRWTRKTPRQRQPLPIMPSRSGSRRIWGLKCRRAGRPCSAAPKIRRWKSSARQ